MQSLPIINRAYDVYKLFAEITHKMEKRWRYSLGIHLESSLLDLLSSLIMAKNAPKHLRTPYLLKASSQLEICVLKLRLCLELGVANETKIFQAQSALAEIGRMLGGWIKATTST